MNDNLINELYEKEVISSVVSNIKRLLHERMVGSMELKFDHGYLTWIDIRTDKESGREVLGG